VYALTIDLNGTLARQASGAIMDWFGPYDADELTFIMYDEYELALQRGEAYNFFDLEGYFG
jgi:hypothetical protein